MGNSCSSMADFQVEIVKEDRYQHVIDFVYADFYPRERLQSAAGLSAGTYFNLVDELIDYMKKDVTLIAIDPATDRVIGIALNTIITEMETFALPPGVEEVRGQVAIMTYLKRLQVDHDVFEQHQFKKGLDIYYLGVKEDYVRRGIARRLTEKTIALSRERQLDFIQSFPTSPGTLHVPSTRIRNAQPNETSRSLLR